MTTLQADHTLGNKAIFTKQHIYKKKYYKSKIKSICDMKDFVEMEEFGELPEDTSKVFFVLKKKQTRAIYFDSFGEGVDTYAILFKALKNYKISDEIFINILRIFDENVKAIEKIDDHNYRLHYQEKVKSVSDQELVYLLSSGTTKGVLLYVLMVASLQNGFDLIVDEIENHFHKTLVENMISLYKDKSVNKNKAALIFTTHYCEVLDLFNRRDNIWIAKSDSKVYLSNMYADYEIRTELLKSKQFYNNTFQTAVNYDELMNMKRKLMK
jgi:AAA15 family ATPase/GTPase